MIEYQRQPSAISAPFQQRINPENECHTVGKLATRVSNVRKRLDTQALKFLCNQLAGSITKDLCEYLIKYKVSSMRHIVNSSSAELIASTVDPELLINGRVYDRDIPPEVYSGLTSDQLADLAENGFDIFQYAPQIWEKDDLFLTCLLRRPESAIEHAHRLMEEKHSTKRQRIINTLPIDYHYPFLPDSDISTEFYMRRVADTPELLKNISPNRPDYQQIAESALKADTSVFCHIPIAQLNEKLINLAISQRPGIMLRDLPEKYRNSLPYLEKAIHNGCPATLLEPDRKSKSKPFSFFNQFPHLVPRLTNCKHWIIAVPDSLHTDALYNQHLNHYPQNICHIPHDLLENKRQWCEQAVCRAPFAIRSVPKKLQDYKMYKLAVTHFGTSIRAVPEKMLEQHPDLTDIAANSGIWKGLITSPTGLKTDQVNKSPLIASSMDYSDDIFWATAILQPHRTPEAVQKFLIEQQDTCNAPILPLAQLSSCTQALLQSFVPISHSYRPTNPIFNELKKILVASKPFALANIEMGNELQQYITRHVDTCLNHFNHRSFPIIDFISGKVEPYGGRTLLQMDEQQQYCRRFKFLRKNEPLNEFFREEAVHLFCHETAAGQRLLQKLKSEVPTADGIALVRKETIPTEVTRQFSSCLETIHTNGHYHCLVYRFKTADKSYSLQAYLPVNNDNPLIADKGLHKTNHDLGVWMSMGVIHPSTIMAFHNFAHHQRLLFLLPLFSDQLSETGCLSFWSTRAIHQSDWVISGLKDLGDIELYPIIEAYIASVDADYHIPGYAQRCSFLEAFVSNMIAGLLQYCARHQNDPDYHYLQDSTVQSQLKIYISEAIENYLTGLFSKHIPIDSFFENTDVFQEWLTKAARETLYWTAPQAFGTDCVTEHLISNGEFSRDIYPDQSEKYYYHCHRELLANALGLSNGPFPLTYILKGLAVIAGGIVKYLQPDQ